jgi:hypothetical protein
MDPMSSRKSRRQEAAQRQPRTGQLNEAKARTPHQRRLELVEQYPDWHQALVPAADALFDLNHYARSRNCSRGHREVIYSLKGAFIRQLYRHGYATEVTIHRDQRDELPCRRCNGSGQAADDGRIYFGRHGRDVWQDSFDEDLAAGGCSRCDGTGWYRPPCRQKYVAFRFTIQGRTYGWHQPADQVRWPYKVTAAAVSWQPEEKETPISLPSAKFADAKALIQFVLDRARSAQSGSAPPPSP